MRIDNFYTKMKRIGIYIAIIAFITMLAASCTTSQNCAAYNDSVRRYQKQVRY